MWRKNQKTERCSSLAPTGGPVDPEATLSCGNAEYQKKRQSITEAHLLTLNA
jgi:hypothetical protein